MNQPNNNPMAHIDPLSRRSATAKKKTAPTKPEAKEVKKELPAVSTVMEVSTPTTDEENQGVSYDALFPEPTVALNRPPVWVLVLGSTLLVAACLFAGFKITNNYLESWLTLPSPAPSNGQGATPSPSASDEASPEPTASPAPSPSPSATPTATPNLAPADVTLRVLNGTNVNGAAATLASRLRSLGFNVASVGNAQSRTYTQTYVYYAPGQRGAGELVAKQLADRTPILQESTLANPQPVLVVIGN